MTAPQATVSAAESERIKLQAQAELERRKRAGVWASSIRAHVEYANDPVGWIVNKLNVPEPTIRWSLNPEYACCYCPQCEAVGNQGRPHLWDGDPDPLVTALETIFAGKSCAVSAGTTTSKAQPIDEPVLTPTGWRPIGDLRIGDLVMGSNGLPTTVIGVFPQGTIPVFEVGFADGAQTRASGDHLWVVQSKKDAYRRRGWRVATTRELEGLNRELSWRIPIASPAQYPERELPLDPYLMGLLLGDGCFRGSYPTISSADSEIVASVVATCGVTVKRRRIAYDHGLVGRKGYQNPLTVKLRDVDLMGKLSHEKRVPSEYLWSSSAQRLALLQGLLDTDGTIDRRGIVSFCSTSPALAEAVVFLVRSLGGLASTTTTPSYFRRKRHRDAHHVAVRLPDGTAPFRLRRKLARVKAWRRHPARTIRYVAPAGTEPCVCIRVAAPDQLYVTRDFIVTHNSYVLGACGTLAFLGIHEDSIVMSIAPKRDLLLKNMWKYIGALWPTFKRQFPRAQILSGNLRMRDGEGEQEVWAATAFGAGVGADEEIAQNLKGFHQPKMLWVVEEFPGVEQALIETIVKTATGSFNPILGLGNPEHQHDTLAMFGKRSWVKAIRISGYDFPNVVCNRDVIPGGRSRESVVRDLADADGNPDNPIFMAQVRGVAPAQAANSLFQRSWLDAAAERYNDPAYRTGPPAMGVDLANSESGDLAAVSRWLGACMVKVTSFQCPDATQLGEDIVEEVMAPATRIDSRHIGMDSAGMGGPVFKMMRRMGLKRLRPIAGNAKAIPMIDEDVRWEATEMDAEGQVQPAGARVVSPERFDNLRSQVLWLLREDFRMGRIACEKNEKLFEELLAHRYENSPGKIIVEEKAEVRKRLRRSPNESDAVAYGNFVRERALISRGDRAAFPKPTEKPHNRDTGLEKYLARAAQRAKAEEGRIRRQFRRRAS